MGGRCRGSRLGSDLNSLKNRGRGMEQRINALEEELKVLKSQIQAVLLDIKECLATGNGFAYSPPAEDSRPAEPRPAEPKPAEPSPVEPSPAGSYAEPVGGQAHRPEAGFVGTDSGGGAAEQPEPDIRPRKAQPSDVVKTVAVGEGSESEVVDLLTISVLTQWLSRAIAAVGRNQTGKLVEIYVITGNLPPRLKEAMLLVVDLYGDGSQDEDTPVTEYVSATTSIQLLIELDSLLRYRSGALGSIVLSMLLNEGPGNRKVSDG